MFSFLLGEYLEKTSKSYITILNLAILVDG